MDITFCQCGGKIIIDYNAKPPHYAQYICEKCKLWKGYIASPETRRKTTVIKNTIKKNGNNRCAFCEQTEEEMINRNFLTVDHKISLAHGGEDNINNTWVLCDVCHKLKNWVMIHARNKYERIKKEEIDETNTNKIARQPL